MSNGTGTPWYQPSRGVRNGVLIALISSVFTLAGTLGLGLLQHERTRQRDANELLERLATRYETRYERLEQKYTQQFWADVREDQQMQAAIDSLSQVVARLEWRDYKKTQRINVLEGQIESLGKVPVMPPELLDLLLRRSLPVLPPDYIVYNPTLIADAKP